MTIRQQLIRWLGGEVKTAVEDLPTMSPKEHATANKEPFVDIISMDLENIHNGAFELDWNDYFIMRLRKEGYSADTDEDIVAQWFTVVCRNIALESYEQALAQESAAMRVERENLDNGRTAYR